MAKAKGVFELFNDLIQKGFVTPLNPTSSKSAQGLVMQSPEKSPHAQIAEEMISIQQRNSKGFRVFDISPFNFPRNDYYPTIDKDFLLELLGSEGVSVAAGLYEDGIQETLPYWRTLEIPVQGNFLKIEFLPARQNEVWAAWDSRFPSQVPDNTEVLDNSDAFTQFSPKHASEKFIFLSFQDNQGNPLIAKHGDVFKSEFTTFFVTFKTTIPRFRITIGYNSSIEHSDDRAANMQIAYGPGFGVFNNPQVNPVPFCITDKDLNGFQNTATGYFQCLINSSFEADLISNVPRILNRCYIGGGANSDLQMAQYTSNYQYNNDQSSGACAISGGVWSANNFQNNGLIIGWITGFTTHAFQNFNIGASLSCCLDVVLEIYRYNSSGSSGTPIKRLISCPLIINANTAGAVNNMTTVANLIEPLRFTLMQRDSLRLFVRNRPLVGTTNNTATMKFSLMGYTLGGLGGYGVNAGFPACPFDAYHKFTENPYPMDQQLGGPSY